ncbi:hypothetical protein [Nocardioides sp.]|uniref:hypothetical protein n=1 Tax=Nocardioides sp. TaxID=35761 RepID=UPI0039E2F7AD
MSGELASLANRIGVTEQQLSPFRAYAPDELGRLDTAVARAMTDEDVAFDKALDEALRFVPKLLRGTAQKLLFPGGRRG